MLDPVPGNDSGNSDRHDAAKDRREKALIIADTRKPILTTNNKEIEDHKPFWPTNFHKGIPHDCHGIPDPTAFDDFQTNLSNKDVAPGAYAGFNVALGPVDTPGFNPGNRKDGFAAVTAFHSLIPDDGSGKPPEERVKVRNWESPLAGHAYELEGPDPGDVGMAAAPPLGDGELLAEMAEVYALAALRDTPFETWSTPGAEVKSGFKDDAKGPGEIILHSIGPVSGILDDLNRLDFFMPFPGEADPASPPDRRRRARRVANDAMTTQTMFRGSGPGAMDGPYLSQFMLIGTGGEPTRAGGQQAVDINAKDVRYTCPPGTDTAGNPIGAADGYISYGAQRVDQRIRAQKPGLDHMTDWTLWLDVQNGAAVNGLDKFDEGGKPRFINTPRDLATYVHFDQLYQAYLNACLLMLEYGVPFDRGMPSGKGHLTRGSFATFGGPHVLALMTEVSSRALKAVRRQKFQHHLRGRPEQVAAMMTLALHDPTKLGASGDLAKTAMETFIERAPNIAGMTTIRNKAQNDIRIASQGAAKEEDRIFPTRLDETTDCGFNPHPDKNYLLPMAFTEGSPMHAAYGAGHATVAGACVTVLKAFFEMSSNDLDKQEAGDPLPVDLVHPLLPDAAKGDEWWTPASMGARFMLENAYVPPAKPWAPSLDVSKDWTASQLTVEGELNKLAANISIGRNMAGVHFYADYYDSLRMGERVAVGILQEQMATYNDPCSMRLRSFDGDNVLISTQGTGDATIEVLNGKKDPDEWWQRHVPQPGAAGS